MNQSEDRNGISKGNPNPKQDKVGSEGTTTGSKEGNEAGTKACTKAGAQEGKPQ